MAEISTVARVLDRCAALLMVIAPPAGPPGRSAQGRPHPPQVNGATPRRFRRRSAPHGQRSASRTPWRGQHGGSGRTSQRAR